jgi:acetyl esterase/lipase
LQESNPAIKGQALWCPWLCLPQSFLFHEFSAPELASPRQCKDADLLPSILVEDFATILQPTAADLQSPIINPLLANADLLNSMPPTQLMVCGRDPLRDHGLLYHKRLHEKG